MNGDLPGDLASDFESIEAIAEQTPVYEPAPLEIIDYDDLIKTFRARASRLGISRETIDEIAGFPDRYTSKILTLSETQRPGTRRRGMRALGMRTLGPVLKALALKLVAIPDDEALERYRHLYVPRNTSQVRAHQPRKKPQ